MKYVGFSFPNLTAMMRDIKKHSGNDALAEAMREVRRNKYMIDKCLAVADKKQKIREEKLAAQREANRLRKIQEKN